MHIYSINRCFFSINTVRQTSRCSPPIRTYECPYARSFSSSNVLPRLLLALRWSRLLVSAILPRCNFHS